MPAPPIFPPSDFAALFPFFYSVSRESAAGIRLNDLPEVGVLGGTRSNFAPAPRKFTIETESAFFIYLQWGQMCAFTIQLD